jgi:mannonate dehydratase
MVVLMQRRQFLQSGVWAAGLRLLAQNRAASVSEADAGTIKLCHRVNARTVTDDDLRFLQQIGLRWVRLEFGEGDVHVDTLRAAQQRFAQFDMRIYSGVHYSYRSTKIQLGQPGRDRDIEMYAQFLRDLGSIGIPVASYDFHPANTYTTNMVQRRGYTAREFDLNDFRNRVEKQQYEREYSADEIWANYTYFVKAVLPVAEEAGVKLALHPDDPPLNKMNGVAKLLTHYDGYHRAEQIAGGSRNWGLTFCVGTWAEGGDRMGKHVFEMIRDFGGRQKIFEVHFRNVTGPLPRFVETFPDDGYLDMYQVMKTLLQVRFSGAVEPDHVPTLAGDTGLQRAGTAYCIAYMRALLATGKWRSGIAAIRHQSYRGSTTLWQRAAGAPFEPLKGLRRTVGWARSQRFR